MKIDPKSIECLKKYEPDELGIGGIHILVTEAFNSWYRLNKHKMRSNNWLKMHGYPMRRRKAR